MTAPGRMTMRAREVGLALLGVVIAFVVGAMMAAALGYPVGGTYSALVRYSIGSGNKFAGTLNNSVPLLLTALSAAISFASGPVNLGQPGQVLIGALSSVFVGLHVSLPATFQIPLLLAAGALGGAAWSLIAAFTRKRFGMDEFITTLMLNEIARLLTDWAISNPLQDRSAGSVTTKLISSRGFLPVVMGKLNLSVALAAVVLFVCALIFYKSRAGYEWRTAGRAPLFARLGGVAVDRNFSVVMGLTGALSGLAGSVLLMAGPHRFVKGLTGNYGWDGVMIAVVAMNGLFACALYAFLFSALQTGAIGMQIRTDIPSEFAQILQATIVLVGVAARGTLTTTWAAIRARSVARKRSPSHVPKQQS
jgi:general nucleoside transport system permease protein